MAEVDMAAARVAVATVPEAARDFGRRARSQVARPPKGTQRQRSPSQPITYCEVGSNGGHSVVSMLLASPRVQAFAFDPLEYSYSGPMVKLLRAHTTHSAITVH